jgi:site-specific DNA recombinase
MKTIGYARVSTAGQAQEGISLGNQIKKIQSYCALNDLELVDIVVDEGLSAKSLKGRPQAQRLIERAKQEKLSVVVYKLDRMFRNTIESISTIQGLEKSGVTFHSINEKLDTSSAMGKFFTTMISAMAELERNVISERTRDALQAKKALGERVGNIAFGYRLNEVGKVVEDEIEQEILHTIRESRKNGFSLQKIANHLNSLGYTTRTSGEFKKTHIQKLVKAA